jgi:DNA-binding PadR family transcriptional regulator
MERKSQDRSTRVDLREVLPLSPRAFYVLLALADGETHGYAIARAVETATDGMVRLTAGTLYPIIRQMLRDGWIAEISGPDDDPRRRSYKLTARGRRVAEAEAERLVVTIRMARNCHFIPAGTHA